ncbi:hypothetical protein NKH80_18480 [Mesorhizobium sp. M0904]|uniref:hypothetical protein n=1 Tax=Mesorhizobium sp. M0904 TaxID=2957022 RepID=UPI00333861C9
MNDFELGEVIAERIVSIPKKVFRRYRRQDRYKENPWPWYVYGKEIFRDLGAEFRKIENKEEMLLCDIVFSVHDYRPCSIERERSIGSRAVDELRRDPGLADLVNNYDDEDVWNGPVIHIVTMLGMCLVRCHQIENYIVNSFLLGISKKQKLKYKTLNDLKDGWKRKTLGNMIASMEEAWEIDPMVKAGFQLFLEMRNRLIHGLTTDDRFDIQTSWGQRELLAFLYFFDIHSRIVKRAFRASFYASIEFAIHQWGLPDGATKRILNKKQKEESDLFFHFFTMKEGNI